MIHAPSPKVLAAVQSVWHQAGFDQPQPGIVPLYELISAYPIWTGEVHCLTQRKAALFLTSKTGLPLALDLTGDDQLSGFLFAQQTGEMVTGCILVDSEDIIQRRRFSAAHEFGHYIMHFLPAIQESNIEGASELIATEGLVYEDMTASEDEDDEATEWWGKQPVVKCIEVAERAMMFVEDWQETEANQFAAELLMPTETCQHIIERYRFSFSRGREFVARRLANELLVSRAAMSWKLKNIDF